RRRCGVWKDPQIGAACPTIERSDMDAITRAEGVLAAQFRVEDLVSLHRYGPAVSARHLSAVRDERVDERAGAQIVGLDRAATERSIVAHDYVGSGRRAGRAGAVRARVDVLTAL